MTLLCIYIAFLLVLLYLHHGHGWYDVTIW